MTTLNRMNPFELLVDSHHGQYVAQVFAQTIKKELFPDVSESDWSILEDGPENESYFDVWAEIDSWETENGLCLYQDGDLWIYDPSFIGSSDEIDSEEIGESILETIPKELKAMVNSIYANLINGPDVGHWSQESLSVTQDAIFQICQDYTGNMPLYYWSDMGFCEEISIDGESALSMAWPAYKAILEYM